MLGLGATGQFAIGEVGTTAGAEDITVDKWFQLLSEPVRMRPRSPAALYPNFFYEPAPSPFVATGWYSPLSEPVREKKGLRPGAQQFLAFNPLPLVSFSWFEGLSEPVRQKRGLPPWLQMFTAFQPAPSPFVATGWHSPLSEPVREKKGLRAHLQMAYAAPSQLRPTPTTTGVLDALETKDIMLAAARVWEKVTSGEIGVIENAIGDGEAGVSANAITSASVSIRIVV